MEKKSTRQAYGEALAKLGRENKDVVVLEADLSKSTMTVFFKKEFPESPILAITSREGISDRSEFWGCAA